jgi:mycothiol synthase
MENRPLINETDIEKMRNLISSLVKTPSITDFEEFIQIRTVQQTTRLWFEDYALIAFVYVDDYNNLCFEIAPEISNFSLEQEIVDWGLACMREKNRQSGENTPLDSSCSALNPERINTLERMGFNQLQVRSMKFIRSLADPIQPIPLPLGYSIRCLRSEDEVEQWVNLHRTVVGTDHMTTEYRLAMMHAPEYDQDMDWVVTASDGNLAAYCIGSIDEEDPTIGALDPIGTHPDHRHRGLSAALIAHGLSVLKNKGLKSAHFGTSSENIPMQQLGIRSGFKLKSESVWFSQIVK